MGQFIIIIIIDVVIVWSTTHYCHYCDNNSTTIIPRFCNDYDHLSTDNNENGCYYIYIYYYYFGLPVASSFNKTKCRFSSRNCRNKNNHKTDNCIIVITQLLQRETNYLLSACRHIVVII